MASLVILCLALAASPAWAGWSYDNGPINGEVDSWTINSGYIVGDTFNAGGTVNGFSFGVWEFQGDVMTSVDWSITSSFNGGTVYGQGTASGANLTDTFLGYNQYGYGIDRIDVTGLSVSNPGGLLWLNLANGTVPSGDPVYWDENSGVGCGGLGCPSQAMENATGTIPSEAFTISGGAPSTTPEPSSIMLFGSGVLGLAGVLRRKLTR
jgi:hypothetical protein